MPKLSQHETLVTIAAMAVLDDGFTAHDVIEVLRALGHADVIAEARAQVRGTRRDLHPVVRRSKKIG